MIHLLHYREQGKGDPIVLLHGFLASSHYFKPLQDRLAATHRVIALDLLGFGASPKPKKGPYTYGDQVAAVHATIRSLGISRFVLIGHSLGALVALRYSLTFPQEVKNAGLLNPPMYKNSQQALETLQGTGLHYRIMLHSPLRDLFWYGAKMLPRLPSNKRRPSINLTDVLRVPGHARKRTYENIILRGEFFADIQKITVPTIVVVGRRDRARYHENSTGWEPPSNVTAVGVESGHHLPVRQPASAEVIIRSLLID
jgi:pimeloyl-ACP methyl ester carboxylesterase